MWHNHTCTRRNQASQMKYNKISFIKEYSCVNQPLIIYIHALLVVTHILQKLFGTQYVLYDMQDEGLVHRSPLRPPMTPMQALSPLLTQFLKKIQQQRGELATQ